jgi:TetR/AcrR family transcriptional regulator, transcriptional repressor for nem operon
LTWKAHLIKINQAVGLFKAQGEMMTGKGAQTRRKIIEKSLQLFSVKGYFNTSISDILQATGLTKGGLYGHFQSKEDIWYAVYEEAVRIWRGIVFEDVRGIPDPRERIERTIANDLGCYMGSDVFEGGCFFFNSLVELSGQSSAMSRHILRGFVRFSRLLRIWLEEAEQKGLIKEGLNLKEIANFIVISLNGAGALYSASRDPLIWKQTINQLRFYINQLSK